MSYECLFQFRRYKVSSMFVNCIKGITNNVKQSEPPKVPLLERWGTYWKNLYVDYKGAALETTKDCMEHPIRTTICISFLASCVYLNKHKPDECSFREHILQNSMKIMQVGEAVRNTKCEHYVKWLGQCYNEGIVRYMNLGIISLIWLDNYDATCTLYKAVCPYLRVQSVTFYQRVIDIGFLDRWWILDSNMKDYDINDAEFNDVNYK